MKKPKGFEVRGKEDYVCKLNKSLYGLKQSPSQWNRRFDEFMTHIKFHRSHYDKCVYFKFPSKVWKQSYNDDSPRCFDDAKAQRVVSRLKNQAFKIPLKDSRVR